MIDDWAIPDNIPATLLVDISEVLHSFLFTLVFLIVS